MANPTREEILKKMRVRLSRLASSKGVKYEDVDDVVQEVFIVLEQAEYKNIDTEADLVPLSCRIVYFKIKENRRKTARLDQLPEDGFGEVPDDSPDALGSMIDYSLRQSLLASIQTAKPDCKELFGLMLAGYIADDIAAKLKLTKSNVYTRTHRCISTLREKMGVNRAGK